MIDAKAYFSSVVQTSSVAYGISYSHRKFTLLTKADRNYLLQSATGVLMESLFFNLSKKLQCNQIIECGAHDAITSKRFVNENSGMALAIEANPFVHAKYKDQYTNSRVDYRSIGLAKAPAKLEMNIPGHHTDESSLEGSLKKRDDFKNYRTIEINVDTLDNVSGNFIDANPTCLWIDVEGLGGEVLAGAQKVLSSSKLKRKLVGTSLSSKPSITDHLFSIAGSKSSKQKIIDWKSNQ